MLALCRSSFWCWPSHPLEQELGHKDALSEPADDRLEQHELRLWELVALEVPQEHPDPHDERDPDESEEARDDPDERVPQLEAGPPRVKVGGASEPLTLGELLVSTRKSTASILGRCCRPEEPSRPALMSTSEPGASWSLSSRTLASRHSSIPSSCKPANAMQHHRRGCIKKGLWSQQLIRSNP